MSGPQIGAVVLGLVAVLLLVRQLSPSPEPDDLTIGMRALQNLGHRLVEWATRRQHLAGDVIVDRLRALTGRPAPPRITVRQRKRDRVLWSSHRFTRGTPAASQEP